MIQFNLLPDVKIQYIKARKLKRSISVIATLVTSVVLACLVLLFFVVNVLQAKHLSDLNKDIKSDTAKLENTPNLDKVLTVQGQLESLPDLHAKKPISSRFLSYISQLTPAKVSLVNASVEFTTNTVNVTGTADALSSINTYVDTLKFAKYQKDDSPDQTLAFSKVVLASFGKNNGTSTYTINFEFDPVIFDGASTIKLIIPSQITTRSETERPDALFQTDTTTNNATKKAGQ